VPNSSNLKMEAIHSSMLVHPIELRDIITQKTVSLKKDIMDMKNNG
jgi:hypothetical protein